MLLRVESHNDPRESRKKYVSSQREAKKKRKRKENVGRVSLSLCLTYVAKQDREEDETVGGADENNAQVHPEVEDLEDLRLGEGQDDDAAELRQRDPGKNLRGVSTVLQH